MQGVKTKVTKMCLSCGGNLVMPPPLEQPRPFGAANDDGGCISDSNVNVTAWQWRR